jgi:hypothetical protein
MKIKRYLDQGLTMSKYVMCIDNSEGELDLTLRRVYRIPEPQPGDQQATADGLIRMIDDSGEDYLYPAKLFVAVDLPADAELAFERTPA